MKKIIYSLLILFSLGIALSVQAKIFYTSGPSTSKKIALTFDDGPGPQTKEYLDLLARYKVKATFFMLGELVDFRGPMAREVLAQGHEIGSHTFNHTNYYAKLKNLIHESNETKQSHPQATQKAKQLLLADMNKTRIIIEKAIGQKIKLCRMPNGIDGDWVHETAQEANFILINWTFGADWTRGTAQDLIPSYIKAIKPGAIILLHDGGTKREKSLQITEAVIKAAQEKGYELVTVGKLLDLK